MGYFRPMTVNGRKFLLVYDGYHSHIGLKVLKTLCDGNIIAYDLLAHTSGTLQSLDLIVFRSFKEHLNILVAQAGSGGCERRI